MQYSTQLLLLLAVLYRTAPFFVASLISSIQNTFKL
nr:MAG TPA: hypothetical protein [Caudoviricetes sp.]